MGLSLGKITSSPWPDLPPDILGLILCQLLCHTDGVSFAAVCHGWRLAAQQLGPSLPTTMPCMSFGRGAYQSLTDDDVKVRHIAAPTGYRAGATFGSWVLYEHNLSRRCFLHNPSSPSTPLIEVPCRYRWSTSHRCGDVVVGDYEPCMTGPAQLEKIVVCSSDLVVAVFQKVLNFGCFLPGTQPPTFLSWEAVVPMFGDQHHGRSSIKDVTFHRGKVFAISRTENLFAYDLVWETPLLLRHVQHVIKEHPAAAKFPPYYLNLVTSFDGKKLLMVRWSFNRQSLIEVDRWTLNLQVFEADMEKQEWLELKDLGGQVLFVGGSGSRALAAVDSPEDYKYNDPRFRGGNRVFLLSNDWARVCSAVSPCKCCDCQKLVNGMPAYFVYDMASGKASLVSLKGHHNPMRSYRSEWFFPPQ